MKGNPATTCSYCLVGVHRRCVGACACTADDHPQEPKALKVGSGSPTPPGTFTGTEICRLTGVTYRQLDYWVRSHLIRPSVAEARGSGTKRCYSAEDVRIIITIKRALDNGCSLQAVRSALPFIREAECRWLVIGAEPAVCITEQLSEVIGEAGGVCTVVDLEVDVSLERSPPAA